MLFNSLDKFYKSHTGAVCARDQITFRVKGDFGSVFFVIQKDGKNVVSKLDMTKKDGYFELVTSFNVGLYFYWFETCDGRKIFDNGDFVGVLSDDFKPFQLTVYSEDYSVPDWIYGGIIYQIFPDRFCRAGQDKNIASDKILHENWEEKPVYLPNNQGKIVNNDFFGGDIQGIISKLSYLKSIGVSVIYLNPIFKAFSNHRYDTGDYMQIDELLGSKDDLCDMISACNEIGIKVILDGVFNHTGDDSIYFNKYGKYDEVGAYQSKNSKYYDWYNFIDYPNKYESWWGIETLPSINEKNKSFIEFITGNDGVLSHYTKLGVCGWRLDVVDELPSAFVKEIRKGIKSENSQAIVIGEVWEDVSNKISYGCRREYFQGKELDSAMNYPLKNAIIEFVKNNNPAILSHTIKEQLDHYPHKSLHAIMNLLSTHDTARLLTVLGGEDAFKMTKTQRAEYLIPEENFEETKFKLKVATLLQFTLCGVPSIYYGDEVGMQGYEDPLNRTTFPWGKENLEILDWFKFLGELRRDYSAFEQGEFEEFFKDTGIYVFKRKDANSELMIAVNLSQGEIDFNFTGELFDLVSQKKHAEKYTLKAKSCSVLVCQ